MAKQRARSSADRQKTKRAADVPTAAHTNRVLGVGLAVYLAILATMVIFDSYTFVLKSAVIPFLLLAAVLSRRFGGFVNDWAVFLGAVVLFDSLRSVVFALTTYFELPMYAGYAIAWERWLCGGAVAPVSAQQLRATLSDPLWLDRFFVLVHASHFLFFLLFGFVLWYLRRDAFRTYAAAMVALLYLALLIQLLVPTLPPWLAARDYLLLEPTERIIRSVYNVHLPSLVAMFDINPIAAMPSLHAAMPALCALLAVHYLGWAGVGVVIYAVAAGVAAVYLGEHYVVDVLAGVLLALAVYVAARRWDVPSESLDFLAKGPSIRRQRTATTRGERIRCLICKDFLRSPRVGRIFSAAVSRGSSRLSTHSSARGGEWSRHETPAAGPAGPVVVALALVAVAFGFGQLTSAWLRPLPVTVAFVERELRGRSPVAHYLLGRIAFDAGDFEQAKIMFTQALDDLPQPAEQEVIRSFLDQCAQRTAGIHPAGS